MQNWHKWGIALGIGALGGIITVAGDAVPPSAWDVVRHALLGMGPAVAGLKMTLSGTSAEEQQPEQAKGEGA